MGETAAVSRSPATPPAPSARRIERRKIDCPKRGSEASASEGSKSKFLAAALSRNCFHIHKRKERGKGEYRNRDPFLRSRYPGETVSGGFSQLLAEDGTAHGKHGISRRHSSNCSPSSAIALYSRCVSMEAKRTCGYMCSLGNLIRNSF